MASEWDKYKISKNEPIQESNPEDWSKYRVKRNKKSKFPGEETVKSIAMRTPVDTLKDIATGLGEAGQNIGDFGARMVTDKPIPDIDIQKEFGTKQGNPAVQGAAKYALPMIAGGGSLIGQMLAQGAFGGTQAQPGEENLGGELPDGPLGGIIEGIGSAALPFGAAKLAKGAIGAGKGIANTVKNAFMDIAPAEQAVQQAAEVHGALKSANPADVTKEAIGKYLEIGKNHRKSISNKITNRVKSIEDYWKDSYEQFKNKIKNLNVNMPKSAIDPYAIDMEAIKQAIKEPGGLERIKAGKVGMIRNKNPYLADLLEIAPKHTENNASEFLDQFQDFKSARHELRQQAKEAATRGERKAIFHAFDKTKDIEKSANKALEEGLGEHAPEWRRVNAGYSEDVHPLRANPLVRQAKKGTLTKNALEKLQTKEPGMEKLRDIVQQDPELMRDLVGQRFAVKPKEVLHAGESMQGLLNEMPELSGMVEKHGKELADYAKRKDISLAEKMRAEKELAEMKKVKKSAWKKVKIGTGAAAGLAGAKTGLNFLYGLMGDN